MRWPLQGEQLQRLYWRDGQPLSEPPQRQLLLDDLQQVQLRLLDSQNRWHSQWPPAGQSNPGQPRALEVVLHSRQFAEIRRLYRLAPGPLPASTAEPRP